MPVQMACSIVAFSLIAEWVNATIETVKTSSISTQDGTVTYSSSGNFGIFPTFTVCRASSGQRGSRDFSTAWVAKCMA